MTVRRAAIIVAPVHALAAVLFNIERVSGRQCASSLLAGERVLSSWEVSPHEYVPCQTTSTAVVGHGEGIRKRADSRHMLALVQLVPSNRVKDGAADGALVVSVLVSVMNESVVRSYITTFMTVLT